MGRYTIGVVSRMLGVHHQTLRDYERRGLIHPDRTAGGSRLYSEEDLDEIRRVLRLTTELGVNLAGAEIILDMRRRMTTLVAERDRLQEICLLLLERWGEAEGRQHREALVRTGRVGLPSRIWPG